MKLGKLEPKHDDRTLMLANYIDERKLPTGTTDVTKHVQAWPLYRNDAVGDCGPAAGGHLITGWTASDGLEPIVPSDEDVLGAYRNISGWNGTLNDPTDRGVYLLDELNYWRQAGIGGRRILAFAKVDVHDGPLFRAASYLFGGLLLGFALPEYLEDRAYKWSLPSRKPHGATKPGSWGGHAVSLAKYDVAGPPMGRHAVVSWGRVVPMSEAFLTRYCDEAYAVLSDDWLGADRRTPGGFDLPTLLSDLKRVTS